MVGGVIHVLSREVLIFFPNCFWDISLLFLQPIRQAKWLNNAMLLYSR
jgi:hypothetical protein